MSSAPIVSPFATSGGSTLPGYSAAATATNGASKTAATGSGASSNNSLANLSANFDSFLTILTTQLKSQDPTNPVDSNQFTQQLVSFAGVQQQVDTNTLLQKLLSATQGNQVSSASSFIGTTIQASGNQGALQNGAATFGYTLGGKAASVQVAITDGAGQLVFSGTGSGNAGSNIVSWDGTNSLTGAKAPDGTYTLSVKASDSAGANITATPFITGTVNSASIQNGTVMLSIGSLLVPESSVTNVTNLPGVPKQTASN